MGWRKAAYLMEARKWKEREEGAKWNILPSKACPQ
jgi:hypothetical protein